MPINCLVILSRLVLVEQIDLRKESTIKFIAPSPYPVITFGPYASPTDVLISLSHAVGNLVERLT